MKIYWKQRGEHIHCRVFTTGLCGRLVFDMREWPDIHTRLSRIAQVTLEPEEEQRS